ncbi:MAG TPA: thioredoxin [Candidatus Nanoarchaeia archaeon]|nr:thioredoxin [Candidatus Nanoarchaeia archaeon]
MIELNGKNYEKEVLKYDKPVLVEHWAEWCGPCRAIAPVIEKLEKEFKGKLKFTKVNVDDYSDIASHNDVRGIPCIIIFSKGTEIDRIVGFSSESQLKKKIEEILKKS